LSGSDADAATGGSTATTVGSLVHGGAERLRSSGSETARLDAELLMGHVLRVERTALLAAPESPVGADHVAAFREFVERRATGEPVAYIRGIKEFHGLAFSVDSRALIPRPETELLVDLGLDRLRWLLTERPRAAGAQLLIAWDVGTGSGAISVALAAEVRRRGYANDVRLLATDISAAALAVATENAVSHGVADLIDFAMGDLTGSVETRPADVLLANLPYVPTATVPTLPVAASFEPTHALDGGDDGLDLVRRLIDELPTALSAEGVALLEIGSDQESAVVDYASSAGLWSVTVHRDLAGLPRVVELARAAGP
jgi:release factor glutamine methyltransferase